MNKRVKELRNSLGFTLEKFGKQLGVGKSVLSQIENGKANLTDKMIKSICNTNWNGKHVNEDWLRYGTEPMYIQPDKFNLGDFAKEHGITELETEIVKTYLEMEPDIRHKFVEHFKKHFLTAPAAEPPESTDEIHDIQQEYSGTPSSIASAEAEYEKRLNIAPHTESTALNTTKNTENKRIG